MMTMVIVCFDVDGCLVDDLDIAREKVRDLLVMFASFPDVRVIVWSGSGADYAERMARLIHVDPYVHDYAAKSEALGLKPDITFDDQDVTLGTVNIRV
jgi:phosphoserine phosphatase